MVRADVNQAGSLGFSIDHSSLRSTEDDVEALKLGGIVSCNTRKYGSSCRTYAATSRLLALLVTLININSTLRREIQTNRIVLEDQIE